VLLAAAVVAAAAVAADSTDPRIKLSKADQARAKAAVLRFSDLGSAWTGGAEKPKSLKIPICPANVPNDHDLTITGHAESALTLSSAAINVDTDVEIFKTAAQVAKLAKRVFQPLQLAACLKYDLEKSIAGPTASVTGVAAIPVAKAGDRSILYRATVAVKSGKKTVPVYSDFLFVSKDRSQFFVNIVSPGSMKTELPSLENGIAKLLASRGI
jgi:hypothetical protein